MEMNKEGEKKFFLNILVIVLILALAVYWFIPFGENIFNFKSTNYNFSLNNSVSSALQFYPNMRFPTPDISYKIEECTLQKKYDMETAFSILEEKTILDFYPVEYGQEISITCSEDIQFEGDYFLAGEGGPSNITIAGDFNIIESGEVFLIQDSNCERPNVAIHELLHALGFDHSLNSNNIMYEISYCKQTISEDIIDYINEIYSIPVEPDLVFEKANVILHGKYLNTNFTIRNNGLTYSEESKVVIFADGKKIKEVNIPPIDAGYGRVISLLTWVPQININKVEFVIENNFSELNKTNNRALFEIKK
jgi:hypothetical protein